MSAETASFRIRLTAKDDAARFWFWDPSHFPGPVTPAAETIDLPAMASGFAAAAAEMRRPLPGQHVRVWRGFAYFGLDLPASADDLAAREVAYTSTVEPLFPGALDRWRFRYDPEATSVNARLTELATTQVSDGALAAALQHAVELRSQQWRIHDLALVPAMEAAARFTAEYSARLGGEVAVQRLLQGFPNRQTEAAEALDRLAEDIRVRRALAVWMVDANPAGGGPSERDRTWFDGRLRAYLDEHGRRAEGWDVGAPTWAEDPSTVLALLRERLRRPPEEPGRRRRVAADERESAMKAALASLAEGERPAFVAALRAAQAYPVISEDHNALIDQQGLAALRAVILEAGRRLAVSGALADAKDAVWLRLRELVSDLQAPRDRRRLVAVRKALHRRRGALYPPRTAGRPLPAWAASNPTLAHFFGLGGEPGDADAELRGVPVAPGVAEGRAFVARGLADLDGLEPGDILICPTTAPAWTPWLGLIAGAVVETGGLLSHTAILAREYGLPCIVSVRDATSRIVHGSRVRIDGDDGSVRPMG